jgi:hypothetical protein
MKRMWFGWWSISVEAVIPLMVAMAIGVCVLTPSDAPAWTKDLPQVNPKTAGPWRGKGSFGKAPFGVQVRHR